jgi:hypothetical protein
MVLWTISERLLDRADLVSLLASRACNTTAAPAGRLDIGDVPFRYVGKHRRASLRDILALKTRIDAQRAAMEALADEAEDLKQRYGV